jgi:phosphoribosylaminoimidazolecarboxamide formyltransferase/IMP cyclohydrolase
MQLSKGDAMKTVRRALLSVSDKSGILNIAKVLNNLNIEILSTGGTAKLLTENNIKITEVSDYTNFPEMMDGRLKTLHPKIHGGLLGRRDIDNKIMQDHNIPEIDLVIVNLYPFKETIEKNDCTFDMAIENIDIGGPTMLRSAAKNHKDVAVIPDPKFYDNIVSELLKNNGAISAETKFELARATFDRTAEYESMISSHLSRIDFKTKEAELQFPKTLNLNYKKSLDLRYGENPHQTASLYTEDSCQLNSVAHSKQLQGKELSYNNFADTDAALECVLSFKEPACVIVKHANPCGVATSSNIIKAYQKAFKCDSSSAFGGIIAFNRPLDKETAQEIINNQFVEVIIAPHIMEEALKITQEKKNIRVLEFNKGSQQNNLLDFKKITGGILIQEKDTIKEIESNFKCVTNKKPSPNEMKDMLFAWKVVKFVKSNAIVYAKDEMSIGIGAGQMSRVFSSQIACKKASDAQLSLNNSAMASDAFFPFRDGIDTAAKQGISCIIQPGGSIRDQEIIDAANEHNITMIFTGIRHFKH